MTLRELIRQVAKENGETCDPRELARYVAKSAPAKQLRELFAEAIIDDCRNHLMGQRNTALTAVRRTNHSPRLAQQRDWWAKWLSASEHVGKGVWKQLGDCTLVDLEFLIHERETNIASIQEFIDKYQTLASLMQQHNVIRVRDLPRDAVDKELAA